MSRRLLGSLLLAASLFTAACAGTPATPIAQPQPAPIAQPAPAPARDDDRAQVRAALAARRQVNVQRFLAYRDARTYPINTFEPGLAHVWMDETGRLCAAATLISADWGRAAVAQVAIEDNFVRLADVSSGPLHDWILTSGLTHHEIVAIQEPMMRTEMPAAELERLYAIYTSVERQLTSLADASLEDAVDAVMARPDLVSLVLTGQVATAGRYTPPAA